VEPRGELFLCQIQLLAQSARGRHTASARKLRYCKSYRQPSEPPSSRLGIK
jgi:hypothetical protein